MNHTHSPHSFVSVFTWMFAFAFFSFLALHFAHMKTPSQYRGVASVHSTVKPLYDASFKL